MNEFVECFFNIVFFNHPITHRRDHVMIMMLYTIFSMQSAQEQIVHKITAGNQTIFQFVIFFFIEFFSPCKTKKRQIERGGGGCGQGGGDVEGNGDKIRGRDSLYTIVPIYTIVLFEFQPTTQNLENYFKSQLWRY